MKFYVYQSFMQLSYNYENIQQKAIHAIWIWI